MAFMVAISDAVFMTIAGRVTALTIRNHNGGAVTGQQHMVDINDLPVYRASHENSIEDFTDNMQLGFEELTGLMRFKILNDGGVIFVEIRRLVASRFSFWWLLLPVTLMRREIVGTRPQAVEKVVKRSVSGCMSGSEAG